MLHKKHLVVFGFAYSLLFPKVSSLESSDAESILDMRLEKDKRYAFNFKWFLTHRWKVCFFPNLLNKTYIALTLPMD